MVHIQLMKWLPVEIWKREDSGRSREKEMAIVSLLVYFLILKSFNHMLQMLTI
jgi:hypothetical protein